MKECDTCEHSHQEGMYLCCLHPEAEKPGIVPEVPICPANGVPEWCPERNADWITPQLVRKTARIDFGLDKEE